MGNWFFKPQAASARTTATPAPEQGASPVAYRSASEQRERADLERLADLLRAYPDLAERVASLLRTR